MYLSKSNKKKDFSKKLFFCWQTALIVEARGWGDVGLPL
jgi:hypothetical protein